jgi:hypothetical protein
MEQLQDKMAKFTARGDDDEGDEDDDDDKWKP